MAKSGAGSRRASSAHVALLRGINVGGKNLVPMADLAELFAAAGCSDVETYIQSGNVVLRAPTALLSRLPALVSRAVADRFGIQVPVVMRAAEDLARIALANPFLAAGADVETLHVAFLAAAPGVARVAALDPDRSPPDRFAVRGSEIYLQCPKGLARTRLTNAYFDSRLETTCTMRNWRTVLKLLEMAGRG